MAIIMESMPPLAFTFSGRKKPTVAVVVVVAAAAAVAAVLRDT